jgi:glycosyltransferase involved in cell wall biosynthesis
VLARYERRLVRRVSAVVTVNHALAAEFSRRYAPRRIVAVYNAPNLPPADEAVRSSLLREAAAIPGQAKVILYHGNITTARGIEQLIEAMLAPQLEAAHLVIMGFGGMREAYRQLAADRHLADRVHVLDAVAPSELLSWIAGADVGAMPIQPSTLNHVLSTPNKLFECLAAGVPVVTSDFPAVREIVLGDPLAPLGAVCEPGDVADVTRACASILELSEPLLADLRARCLRASRERWNWQAQAQTLVSVYREVQEGQ